MHIGFRKIISNVLFSQIYGGTDKIKAIKRLKPSPHWYQASFYSSLIFDDSNFILFRKNDLNNYPCLIGSYLNSNLLQIILKRKILTGHPYRAKKKWCIIKFMFFTPEDAKYFIKNNIYTKKGLKGKLKESLGTHGLVKATFNNSVKQSDTICMNLYKRVFPKFPINI